MELTRVLAIAALLIAVVFAVIPVIIAVVRVARRWAGERSAPPSRAEARVVDKRTQLKRTGSNPDQRYYVTFEFTSGSRAEFEVPATEAGILVVGDAGVPDWRGTRYQGFAREILR